jgi:hypothetical protein
MSGMTKPSGHWKYPLPIFHRTRRIVERKHKGETSVAKRTWDKEPWRIINDVYIATADDDTAIYIDEVGLGNAERIVACVNACRNFSTDELDAMVFVKARPSEMIIADSVAIPEGDYSAVFGHDGA